MTQLIYFVEGAQTMTRDRAGELGLAHAVSEGLSFMSTSNGPEGRRGVLFAPEAPRLAPNMSWTPLGERAWVGFDLENPPKPEQLIRSEQFPGHQVKLSDGQEWLIPVARCLDGTTLLPKKMEYRDGAWIEGDLQPRYQSFFQSAVALFDRLMGIEAEGEHVQAEVTTEIDLAAHALGLNYRLGPAEISALGLLDTRTAQAVALAVIDWPTFIALKKKMESEPASSAPGSGD